MNFIFFCSKIALAQFVCQSQVICVLPIMLEICHLLVIHYLYTIRFLPSISFEFIYLFIIFHFINSQLCFICSWMGTSGRKFNTLSYITASSSSSYRKQRMQAKISKNWTISRDCSVQRSSCYLCWIYGWR